MKRFNIPRDEVLYYIEQWCFSRKYREILKLKFLEGLTYEEISAETGMSVRHIQKIVKEEGGEVLKHINENSVKIS